MSRRPEHALTQNPVGSDNGMLSAAVTPKPKSQLTLGAATAANCTPPPASNDRKEASGSNALTEETVKSSSPVPPTHLSNSKPKYRHA
ncbi:hypothetical protein S7711_11204 [Stachybotrys chartarum IBT 7711]|uniref:Uncharacterized protein n=1 Tax=Stachybotrys chartarum (strain CBS 109288 / IBT 7711) TaxID=1280523 RepID=A0A084ANC6_STACB|nr:hypothetical protein S7711_11204 [Stachybotrys chartarum IBT 7711]KFA48599.1 hypothetical protein S40293_10386 [Stachybotrys chartarum IBT 40293]